MRILPLALVATLALPWLSGCASATRSVPVQVPVPITISPAFLAMTPMPQIPAGTLSVLQLVKLWDSTAESLYACNRDKATAVRLMAELGSAVSKGSPPGDKP